MSETGASFHAQRVFPHSPQRLYQAFAEARQLAAWWGPAGFRNEFERFDFRPGGDWVFVMVGPDGSRYPNRSRFQVLEPGERLSIRHDCDPFFTLELRLRAVPEGCALSWTQTFDDPAVAAAVRAIVEPANQQNLDRLGALLAGG